MKTQNLKLAILGGGQLGRMLIQKAIDYDIQTYVLDKDSDCSCRSLCTQFTQGDINNYDMVLNFGRSADVITIEIEHVNVDALEKLESLGKKVYPQSSVIRTVQDKGLQKLFYEKHKIPSASFFLTESRNGIIARAPKFPFVQKLRKSGYDGKGVVIIRSAKDMDKTFDAPCVVEEMADIEKEISILVTRNIKGAVAIFPAVELVFNKEANLVDYLFSPANITEQQFQEASQIAQKIIETLNMVGLLAVEMFISKDGKITVNEIAPRPHNSGHQTIEANISSQYEQHIRAIVGMPPGSTKILSPSAMLNLLGEQGFDGEVHYEGMEEAMKMEGVSFHLYGKKITRPFRKMGHVTVLGSTLDEALKKVQQVKKLVKVLTESKSDASKD